MKRNEVIEKLNKIAPELEKEGFFIEALTGSYANDQATPNSDIDLLYHLNASFIKRYGGFQAFKKLEEIRNTLHKALGRPVDLIASNNLSQTAKRFMKRYELHR